jgi:hypothetical protein
MANLYWQEGIAFAVQVSWVAASSAAAHMAAENSYNTVTGFENLRNLSAGPGVMCITPSTFSNRVVGSHDAYLIGVISSCQGALQPSHLRLRDPSIPALQIAVGLVRFHVFFRFFHLL